MAKRKRTEIWIALYDELPDRLIAAGDSLDDALNVMLNLIYYVNRQHFERHGEEAVADAVYLVNMYPGKNLVMGPDYSPGGVYARPGS